MDKARITHLLNEIKSRCEGFVFVGLACNETLRSCKPGQPLTTSLAYMGELQCRISMACADRIPAHRMKPAKQTDTAHQTGGTESPELMTLDELRLEISSFFECWVMGCISTPDFKNKGGMDIRWSGGDLKCLGLLADAMIMLSTGCRGSGHGPHSLEDFPEPPEVVPVLSFLCELGDEDPDRAAMYTGATFLAGYQIDTHVMFKNPRGRPETP